MTSNELPVVCSLNERELQERRRRIQDSIKQTAVEISDIADGYCFRFAASSETFMTIAGLVDMERQCCPFLTFNFTVEAGNGSICLQVTGPPQAKAMIADFFGA